MKKILQNKKYFWSGVAVILVIISIVGLSIYRKHVIDSAWNTETQVTPKKVKKEKPKSKKHVENAKTVSFNASGDYVCGEDFNPGTYYVELTKIKLNKSDKNNEGYVFVDVSGEDSMAEMWGDAGSKKRRRFDKGDVLKLEDDKSPEWTLTLFSEKDYKKGNIKLETKKNNVEKNKSNANQKDTKYVQHVRDYVGRNASDVGSMRLGGDFMDDYGEAHIKIVFITNDGSKVTEDNISEYVVDSQDTEPGTEIKITYLKDENGKEYSSLCQSSLNEIDVHVKKG